MRPSRHQDEIELPNEAEIEAALRLALESPVPLAALREFAEKNESPRPAEPVLEAEVVDSEAIEADVISLDAARRLPRTQSETRAA